MGEAAAKVPARKSLGQHFLPESYCRKMVGRIELGPSVLEIGSGPGGLTRALVAAGARVVAVEIDERFPAVENVETYRADFLELDLSTTPVANGRWQVVANIPYYITTAILEKLLGPDRRYFTDLYLLLQQEVADRILQEGERASGSLTLFVSYHAVPRRIMNVPGRVFQPPARVDSTLLHLALRPTPPVSTDPKRLFEVVHQAFSQRRKMLRTSLRARFPQVETALQASGVEPTVRPERLKLADFARLADALAAQESPSDARKLLE